MKTYRAAVLLFLIYAGVSWAQGNFSLSSPMVKAGQDLHPRYTCEGRSLALPLAIANPPPGTQTFALIVEDPDAPDPKHPKGTFTHWVVYNIPTETRYFSGAPKGAEEGMNDGGKKGYYPPCPPVGRHRYIFRLFALDSRIKSKEPLANAALRKAMEGHILGEVSLTATYRLWHRPKPEPLSPEEERKHHGYPYKAPGGKEKP